MKTVKLLCPIEEMGVKVVQVLARGRVALAWRLPSKQRVLPPVPAKESA